MPSWIRFSTALLVGFGLLGLGLAVHRSWPGERTREPAAPGGPPPVSAAAPAVPAPAAPDTGTADAVGNPAPDASPSPAPGLAASAAPPPGSDIPLEKLLTWKTPLEPAPLTRAEPPPEDETGPGSRIHLEQRVDVTTSGPLLRKSRSVDVAVPVDEDDTVRLRGGVRIDESGRGLEDARTAPTVGIEKRF